MMLVVSIWLVCATLLATFWLCIHLTGAKLIYTLLECWNSLQSHQCSQQNEQLRLAALPHCSGDTAETSSFGLTPSLVPADACPWKFVRDFDQDIAAHQQQILEELISVSRHYNGIPFGQVDAFQGEGFGALTRWRTMWVYLLGRYGGVADYLPTLTSIVKRHQQHLGLVILSSLTYQHIPPHTGPMSSVLRYHRSMVIPDGDLGMKIDGRPFRWSQQRGVVFDDRLVHESWNHTTTPRVVIFADIIRPMPFPMNYVNRVVYKLIQRTRHLKSIQDRLAREGIKMD